MERNIVCRVVFFFLLFLVNVSGISQPYSPGNSYFGRNKYIEYVAGNLPLIISVPHGGNMVPQEIPDRTCGDETVTDSYTINLANEIKSAIFKMTGCFPHIIICNLKRTKLDANRDISEAACGNEYAGIAWNEFHAFMDTASANIRKKNGKGLLIDLHGHGHSIQRLELGYLLTAAQLGYSNATLNSSTFVYLSSIRSLINSNVSGQTHSDLIRGPYSLGSMFAVKGYPAVPSADDPFPQSGQPYFSGGFTTERHGSDTSGMIDAIQMECNQNVRFNEPARLQFAQIVAVVLLDFLTKHYFPQLPLTYCNYVHSDQLRLSGFMIYPNPFSNFLYFQSLFPCELVIYNSQGNIIYSKSIQSFEKINLENLKEGIYFVNLKMNNKTLFTQRIIKMK
jgi:N-formylglutamate amidohydrolase